MMLDFLRCGAEFTISRDSDPYSLQPPHVVWLLEQGNILNRLLARVLIRRARLPPRARMRSLLWIAAQRMMHTIHVLFGLNEVFTVSSRVATSKIGSRSYSRTSLAYASRDLALLHRHLVLLVSVPITISQSIRHHRSTSANSVLFDRDSLTLWPTPTPSPHSFYAWRSRVAFLAQIRLAKVLPPEPAATLAIDHRPRHLSSQTTP
ncbi:hypothetical protein K438DRAFT_2008638 [Mycena galopus ATCC 62051]|nr:hypothetical protein K438DRAFT_2008638 [Mycena galopus ATCC 62051]